MIRIVKGQPLPTAARDNADRHPLAIAARVTRAIGLALMLPGLFVFTLPIAFTTPEPGLPTMLAAGGIVLAGAILAHQGSQLLRRVVDTEMRKLNSD